MPQPIYLDYAATTPVDARVLEAMLPFFTHQFGNAASRHHQFGWEAADAVANARQQVAQLIGANEKEIVFTSGATEAINLAIKGCFEASLLPKKHIITTQIEHKAVLDTCHHLEKWGAEITYLPVNENGELSLTVLENAIRPETMLISVIWGNNEIGTIQAMKEIVEVATRKAILLHVDATQTVGKIPIDLHEFPIDLLSFSGHKIYAPKGIGALYIRKNTPLVAQQDGGKHERGRRSGTLNIPGIVGLGQAAELLTNEMTDEIMRIEKLRNLLEGELLVQLTGCRINAKSTQRLPHITNVCFPKIDGEELLNRLTTVAVSNGSACNSATTEPSYVLRSIGLSEADAYSSIRFSLGRFTTDSDIFQAVKAVKKAIESL